MLPGKDLVFIRVTEGTNHKQNKQDYLEKKHQTIFSLFHAQTNRPSPNLSKNGVEKWKTVSSIKSLHKD